MFHSCTLTKTERTCGQRLTNHGNPDRYAEHRKQASEAPQESQISYAIQAFQVNKARKARRRGSIPRKQMKRVRPLEEHPFKARLFRYII